MARLGRDAIAWAAERGCGELFTTTGVSNTALRRQKAKLGYVERDGPILVRARVRRLPATARLLRPEFGAHLPTWVVMAVYLVRELHFSPLQLVLMGTAMEARGLPRARCRPASWPTPTAAGSR